MAQNKTGFDPTQTAEYWLEKDVYTVPLQSRSKRPKAKNWPHLRLVEDDLKAGAFKPGDNIGALWGDPSAHATDVDLDMDEAIWVAEQLLPDTFIYGRTGKEYSHYVYRVAGAKTKKWQTRELGTIVEIRSTGAQSVIPPSRHPEGGFYFTHEDVDFISLTKLDLERYCDEIAVAAIFVHYYPEAGSRHDFVHACTGALCHQRWPASKVKRVMGAVLTIIQEEDDEMNDRMTAVVNTIEKHDAGDRTKGFTTLADWMSMEVISAVRRWTQSGMHEGQIVTRPVLDDTPSAEPKKTVFDEQLLEVPGLVGECAEWARKAQYLDQPIFSLATGIMCTALASSNNYVVQHWDTPLQPYMLVTAPTGGGKNSVLSSVGEFARRIGLDEVIFRGFQSYYAMLDILGEEGMACWLWDEAARHMANIRSTSQGQDFTVLTHVISMYGAANQFVPGVPGRKNTIPALDHPFFTLLATAQPDALMEAITGAARETGFVNRFMLFDTGDYFPARNMRRTRVFPSALKKHARALLTHEPNGEFTEVLFEDTDTYQRFDQFEEASRRKSRKDETWARANQNALILAGVAAVGVDAHRPVITPDLARWAIRLISWSNDCWAEKMRFIAQGTNYVEKNAVRVEAVISQPQKYLKQQMSPNQRLALKAGMMPNAVLTRNTKGMKRHEREQIINDLLDADVIGCTEAHNQACYFRKSYD